MYNQFGFNNYIEPKGPVTTSIEYDVCKNCGDDIPKNGSCESCEYVVNNFYANYEYE